MTALRVGVLGDSAVWGQGLAPNDKFAVIAAREIARRAGRDLTIDYFTARSGAKIDAAERAGATTVALPSGTRLSVPNGDRLRFFDVYPELFDSDAVARDFLAGTSEELAFELYGEIPATFPTITYQVQRVPHAVGEEIELVILDGSINDVDTTEVLDPDGKELGDLAEVIRRFAFVGFRRLIGAVRSKFPRATIVATGYFSPFSPDSDTDELKALAKYLSGRPEWQLALNDVLVSPWGKILLFPLSLLGTDVGEAVEEVVARSGFAHRRGLYWLRRVVSELNETSTERAGLIFAHPGFRPENSAFASGLALLHEGYKLPGAGDHEVADAVQEQRQRSILRLGRLGALRIARDGLRALIRDSVNVAVEEILERLADLSAEIAGPTSMRAALDAVVGAQPGLRLVRAAEALPLVEAEIGRIEVSMIASFVHPNEAGARRYADVIVRRHARHVETSVRNDLTRLLADGTISVRDSFVRYGFPPSIGLRAFLQHMTVDTLAIEMVARSLTPTVPARLIPVFLGTGGSRRFPLDDPFGGLSVVDTYGDLHLSEVRGVTLELGIEIPVRFEVEDVRFQINGRTVFESPGKALLEGGRPLSLPYPR